MVQVKKFKAYLRHSENLSEPVVERHLLWLARWQAYLQGEKIADMFTATTDDVIAFAAKMKQEYSGGWIGQGFACLRRFYDWAIWQEQTRANPFSLVKARREQRKTIPRYFTEEEIQAMLYSKRRPKNPREMRDLTILRMMYASGARVSEFLSLNITDLEWDHEGHGAAVITGKGGQQRMLFFSPPSMEYLNSYLAFYRALHVDDPRRGPLFVGQRGERLVRQRVAEMLKAHAKRAGIKKHVTPHMLRHSFATHLMNAGVGLRQIQELLGHRWITSTQVYTHVANEKLRVIYSQRHPDFRRYRVG